MQLLSKLDSHFETLGMAFTLVDSGEHLVTDVMFGWLYAITIFVVGNRPFDRYEAWHANRATERTSPAADLIGATS